MIKKKGEKKLLPRHWDLITQQTDEELISASESETARPKKRQLINCLFTQTTTAGGSCRRSRRGASWGATVQV